MDRMSIERIIAYSKGGVFFTQDQFNRVCANGCVKVVIEDEPLDENIMGYKVVLQDDTELIVYVKNY